MRRDDFIGPGSQRLVSGGAGYKPRGLNSGPTLPAPALSGLNAGSSAYKW